MILRYLKDLEILETHKRRLIWLGYKTQDHKINDVIDSIQFNIHKVYQQIIDIDTPKDSTVEEDIYDISKWL